MLVTPTADVPRLTNRHEGKLVIINRDPTPLDSLADQLNSCSIEEALTTIDKAYSGVSAD